MLCLSWSLRIGRYVHVGLNEKCVRKVRRRPRLKCQDFALVNRETIHTLVKKRQGCYWTNNRTGWKRRILFHEKLNEFGARLERSPQIYLRTEKPPHFAFILWTWYN
jgi:hypothetical protein